MEKICYCIVWFIWNVNHNCQVAFHSKIFPSVSCFWPRWTHVWIICYSHRTVLLFLQWTMTGRRKTSSCRKKRGHTYDFWRYCIIISLTHTHTHTHTSDLASLNFLRTPGWFWLRLLLNQRSTCLTDKLLFLDSPSMSAWKGVNTYT